MNGVLREQAQSFLTLYGYLPSKKATVPWKDVAGCMALFAERLILRCCGPIEADRLAREVRVHGQLCPMRPRCFDLLVFFLENQDRKSVV